jgi:hypothetical protein
VLSRALIKKQRGRRPFTAVAILGLVGSLLLSGGTALAVHDINFQLDGDTTSTDQNPDAPGTPALDWNDLFNADGTSKSPINPGNATGFTHGDFVRDFQVKTGAKTCSLTATTPLTFCTVDATTFATGSKDILAISGWQCNKDNNVNSKIDIMNAYAASFKAANGDRIIYFGLDKNKDNGNNNVGFWFLQGNANCDATNGTQTWSGSHSDGDVLVVSEFTNGGGVSGITAYRWTGGANGCIDSTPLTANCDGLSIGTGGDCKVAAGSDDICATTNSGQHPWNTNITTDWLTADATLGVGHTVVPPDFFEGGINITKIFAASGGAPSCFNTFIADTRSSQETTATLFDYARGTLGECSASITTQASTNAAVTPGTVVTDTATITGTSGNTPPFPNSDENTGGSNVKFYICELLAGTGDCTSTAVQVGNASGEELSPTATQGVSTATSDGYDTTGKAPGRYCFYAVWPGDSNYTSGASGGAAATECFTIVQLPSTTVTTSSPTGDTTPGASVTDTATVSGSGATPTGTVTFFLCQPNQVTSGGCEGTAGTQVGSAVQLVSGSATSDAVSGATTTTLGKYCWRAEYSGDGLYEPSAHTNATTECFTVRTSASGASAQRWLPNDRIVVTSAHGNLAGTLAITLRQDTCNGTVVYTEPVPNSGAFTATTAGAVYNTTNSTVFVGTKADGTAGLAAGTYFWRVVFTPTSQFATGFTKCETSTLTINDNP